MAGGETGYNCTFGGIAKALRDHKRFLVLGHLRPDGDAIGCQLAMAHMLLRMGAVELEVWNQDAIPEKLRFLPGSEMVKAPPSGRRDFDVVVALDTSDRRRLGTALDAVGEAGLWINIDHHPTNDRYGDLNYIDSDSPATGQILFELIRATDLPFSYEVADNLFAAISTDTGSFQYPNTTARTFEIAAELIKAGVNVGEISTRIYESYPLRRIELLRSLLNSMRISCGGRVASIKLPFSESRRIGSKPEDTEGLIDHIRAIEGIVVAAFIEEMEGGEVRASLRSKDSRCDVSEICGEFDGGGHAMAAGARIELPLEDAEERLLEAICRTVGRHVPPVSND